MTAHGKQIGVGNYPPYLAFALGAGETTVLAHGQRLFDRSPIRAASMPPTLIDYVQDRHGKVIWRADNWRLRRLQRARLGRQADAAPAGRAACR